MNENIMGYEAWNEEGSSSWDIKVNKSLKKSLLTNTHWMGEILIYHVKASHRFLNLFHPTYFKR